jgi:hypothetical protein
VQNAAVAVVLQRLSCFTHNARVSDHDDYTPHEDQFPRYWTSVEGRNTRTNTSFPILSSATRKFSDMAVARRRHLAAAGKDSIIKVQRRPRQAFYSSWREFPYQALTAWRLPHSFSFLFMRIYISPSTTKHCTTIATANAQNRFRRLLMHITTAFR